MKQTEQSGGSVAVEMLCELSSSQWQCTMQSSCGQAAPGSCRVYSTLNQTRPCACGVRLRLDEAVHCAQPAAAIHRAPSLLCPFRRSKITRPPASPALQTKKVNTLIRPDGTKKAYVRLTSDYDALDVANKIGVI